MTELMPLDLLILKYLSDTLTEEQKEYLLRWRDASEQNRETFERLTNTEWLGTELEKLVMMANTEEAWKKLQMMKDGDRKIVELQRNKWRWVKIAAAVVLALILGVAGWVAVRTPKVHNLTQEERFSNDLPPGKEGAVLTLPDGGRMQLDSLGDGLLAIQPGSRILKQGGQLSYRSPTDGKMIQHTLSTPRGRTFSVVLSDGTIVWLNAASSLTFPTFFEGPVRQVEAKGEVYFEVAKTGKPFLVMMDKVQVEVLGTKFNTNDYPGNGSTKVSVADGSVMVNNREKGTAGNSVILAPGQEAILQDGKTQVVKANADLEETLSWMDHTFFFNEASIEQVMRQLERWYDIETVYDDKIDVHFSGTIPMNVNISTVLKVLELTKGVSFVVDGRKVVVRKN